MPVPTNPFKQALAAGEKQIGCWMSFADGQAAEIMGTAGFDWLVIDAEHAPNDLRSVVAQLQAMGGHASHPVVRLPMSEAWAIKQVLDAGAQSLLIPMVESAEQARNLVRAMRYPPHGIRGAGAGLGRASLFSAIPDYAATANAQLCLLVMVETRAGLAALDEILEVEGVDGVFVGPADLAADMGHLDDSTAPEVQQAIRDVLGRVDAAGKVAGIIAFDDDSAQRYLDWGARFLGLGADVLMLAQAARATAARWKNG